MKTFCRYFNQEVCKSCDLITLDYSDQIKLKEQTLGQALSSLSHPPLEDSVTSRETHFRNKAKLVVTGTISSPIIGLWGESELDQGRELLACPLHLEEVNEILPHLKSFIQKANLRPYEISSRTGELKGIILFHSEDTDETYIRFVLRSQEARDRIRKYLPQIQEACPHVKCISLNIQPTPHAILEGPEEIFLTEVKNIQHKVGTQKMSLGPQAFVQTNQEIAQKLYRTAADWIRNTQCRKFLELYCGQGAFSFSVAPFVTESLGIEVNPEAVRVANMTAQENHLEHLKFKASDAQYVEEDVKAFGPDVILVNPPRSGLKEVTAILNRQRPQYILYSSCNYQTLAKDLKELEASYRIERIQIFDMFPHTRHFETLVQLKLKDE